MESKFFSSVPLIFYFKKINDNQEKTQLEYPYQDRHPAFD